MRRWFTSVLPVLFLCSALPAPAADSPKRTQPPASPVAFKIEPYLAAARKAVDAGTLPAFAASLEDELRRAISNLNAIDTARLNGLAPLREFGRYFGRIEKLDATQKQTLQWLAVQSRFLPALMAAVSETDAPQDVLTLIRALLVDSGNRLNDYPDLAAAVCVVWDAPLDAQANRPGATTKPSARKPPDVQHAVRRFHYFSDPKYRFPFDMKAMPWQIAVYVVDSPVSDDEIAWATQRYATKRVVSNIYFEVPYDMAAFRAGKRRIDGDQYTLPNIKKYGGVCLDQAYYAAHVCKALGVPATICVGQSGSEGELHGWVGFLQPTGKSASWNFNEARYAAMLFWTGQVNDPQGGPPLSDADVSLMSELTSTAAEKRLASVMLYKSRDLLPPEQSAELFMKSIDLSPGNRQAWMGLAALGSEHKLDLQQTDRVTGVVHRFAVERYPDFAFAVYRKIISGRTVEEQLAAMTVIGRQFQLRPDLVATVEMAKGDLLRDNNRAREALAAYQQAMSDPTRIGLVLVEAAARADALLRAGGDMQKLVALYKSAWARTPTPQPSGYADLTPFCVIGHKYAEVLKQTGDQATAANVERRVMSYEGQKGT
jgi:hypothetical protein